VRSSKTYVVDTSALLAYIVENAMGREKVVELVEKARHRGLYLYATYMYCANYYVHHRGSMKCLDTKT
jgi:predicted nucleic acid-binding protein